jgi:hypothetical protein
MKIDVLLIPVGARYPEMRAAALAAEESGFDGVDVDHLRDPEEAAEPACPRRGRCSPRWPRPRGASPSAPSC